MALICSDILLCSNLKKAQTTNHYFIKVTSTFITSVWCTWMWFLISVLSFLPSRWEKHRQRQNLSAQFQQWQADTDWRKWTWIHLMTSSPNDRSKVSERERERHGHNEYTQARPHDTLTHQSMWATMSHELMIVLKGQLSCLGAKLMC